MIEWISDNRKIVFWLVFHLILGAVAVYTNLAVIVWYYVVTLVTIFTIVTSPAKKGALLVTLYLIYTGAFELLGRMSKCSPYIPYELSKYSFFVMSIVGILLSLRISTRSLSGIFILLLTLPAVFIDVSGRVVFSGIVFNIIGLMNVALGIILFSSLTISFDSLQKALRLLMFPIVSIMVFAFIRTPDINEIEFSLGAMKATSGGFGSNQVSTVFGLGFMIMTVAAMSNMKLFKYRWLDTILALAFLMQGLLTFSRGGMIGGLLGIVVFIYFAAKIPTAERRFLNIPNIKVIVIPVVLVMMIGFVWVDNITQGMLVLRYQGETEGTLRGSRERDVNTITSGRIGIFEADMDVWNKHILFGVGVGASRYERQIHKDVAPHTELSRLFAEHGVLGALIVLLLVYVGYTVSKERIPYTFKGYKIMLLTLAIVSTFHSATRTFVTPLLFSMACMNVVPIPVALKTKVLA